MIKLNMCFVLILICVVCEIQKALSGKILGVFQMPAKSHYILGEALLKPLAERGHEVTMISPFKTKSPTKNYGEIVLEEAFSVKERLFDPIASPNISKRQTFLGIIDYTYELAEVVWKHNEVQKLIHSDKKFDLIIFDSALGDSLLSLAPHFEASSVFFCSFGSNSVINSYVGNPTVTYVSNAITSLTDETSFFERLLNIAVGVISVVVTKYWVHPFQQQLINQYMPRSPAIGDLITNVTLILSNSHYSMESPRPYVPNFVQIGGFYSGKTKTLPRDLQEFLDSAKNGAILFCLGTNIKIADVEKPRLDAIIRVLESVAPIKVLFKSEIDLPNVSNNIRVHKWLPQVDILAHPNIKVFVTHGGLGGISESIAQGIPTVAIPFFGDQENNVAEAVRLGISVQIKYKDLNEQTFSAALTKILTTPKYKKNAKLRSQLLKDQPIEPLEKAVYWIEHVMRYKGAPHLRNAGMKLTWYQNYMIDIILFIFMIILAVVFISFKLFIFLLQKLKTKMLVTKSKKKND